MTLIVREQIADDYIIATGEAHSIAEFCELAFRVVGLDWRDHVIEGDRILTRPSVTRIGNASRLRARTGWKPSVTFRDMVEVLVEAALRGAAGRDAA
jgi:GDPmannose 4,6-dehydratase